MTDLSHTRHAVNQETSNGVGPTVLGTQRRELRWSNFGWRPIWVRSLKSCRLEENRSQNQWKVKEPLSRSQLGQLYTEISQWVSGLDVIILFQLYHFLRLCTEITVLASLFFRKYTSLSTT